MITHDPLGQQYLIRSYDCSHGLFIQVTIYIMYNLLVEHVKCINVTNDSMLVI